MGPSMMGFEQTDNQTEEKVAKIIHRRKKKHATSNGKR